MALAVTSSHDCGGIEVDSDSAVSLRLRQRWHGHLRLLRLAVWMMMNRRTLQRPEFFDGLAGSGLHWDDLPSAFQGFLKSGDYPCVRRSVVSAIQLLALKLTSYMHPISVITLSLRRNSRLEAHFKQPPGPATSSPSPQSPGHIATNVCERYGNASS